MDEPTNVDYALRDPLLILQNAGRSTQPNFDV